MRTNTARLTALTSLALASGLALSACGDAGESGEDAEAADGITLELGEFNWLASEFQGAVITQIIEDYPELGISDVSTTQFDPAVGWTGLGSGDVDLLVDVIMPNHEGFAEENEDTVEIVSEVYGGAAQGGSSPSMPPKASSPGWNPWTSSPIRSMPMPSATRSTTPRLTGSPPSTMRSASRASTSIWST